MFALVCGVAILYVVVRIILFENGIYVVLLFIRSLDEEHTVLHNLCKPRKKEIHVNRIVDYLKATIICRY